MHYLLILLLQSFFEQVHVKDNLLAISVLWSTSL